ncbi:MAG TPA: tail fiber protein [Aliidongia sp.]|nr:tail fiber protein [Aliidongia sp.]
MSTPYVGEIRVFSFPRVPTGWFACDGSLKSISEYQVLFALIGTTYGGDGQTTFAVPDMRGQLPVHQGTGLGLSTRVIGQVGGTESVTLLTAQMPAHNHPAIATTAAATTATPSPSVVPATVASPETMYVSDLTGATAVNLAPASVGNAGNTLPHDNTMPTLTLSICIAYNGVFPSRN